MTAMVLRVGAGGSYRLDLEAHEVKLIRSRVVVEDLWSEQMLEMPHF